MVLNPTLIIVAPEPPFSFDTPIIPNNYTDYTCDVLVKEGNDVLVLRFWENETEFLQIEDFGTDNVANFPGHEQEIVDFMLNSRAYYGVQTILAAGLKLTLKIGGRGLNLHQNIFTIFNPSVDTSYAYLGFTHKGWHIYLNGSPFPIHFATWDNLVEITKLAEASKNKRNLEIELGLLSSKNSAQRKDMIQKYDVSKVNAFDEIEANKVRKVFLDRLQKICKELYAGKDYPPVPNVNMPLLGGTFLGLPYIASTVGIMLMLPNLAHLEYIKDQLVKYSKELEGILYIDPNLFTTKTKEREYPTLQILISKNEKAFAQLGIKVNLYSDGRLVTNSN